MNDTSKNKQAHFLPFHAINEFMRTDFRAEVVRSALQALAHFARRPALPDR